MAPSWNWKTSFLAEVARRVRAEARDVLNVAKLRQAFPELHIGRHSIVSIDDVAGLTCHGLVHIGPFCEIVIEHRSAYTPIAGKLILGHHVTIGSFANIRAGGGVICLGDDVLLAQKVSIIAANHMLGHGSPYREGPWDTHKTGVLIEPNAWIGAGATILPGCSIGTNSVVAAGSVVTRSIPSNELWAGIPARFVRAISKSLCAIPNM